MAPSTTPNITQLLVAWKQGDQDALAQLTPLVYKELYRLAHGYLAGERRWQALDEGRTGSRGQRHAATDAGRP